MNEINSMVEEITKTKYYGNISQCDVVKRSNPSQYGPIYSQNKSTNGLKPKI